MILTIAERLAQAVDSLTTLTETPRLDAEILMAHAMSRSRASLLARLREPYNATAFEELLDRRLDYEPIAYILGEWEFFSIKLYTESPVLVPRPETEHLVEVVLEHLDGGPGLVADLCTGSGCVAVAIAHNSPNCCISVCDISPKAVELAERNVSRHNLSKRIHVFQSDMFDQVPDVYFDIVCANPPYVRDDEWEELSPVIRRHEDPGALLSGEQGLDHIKKIVEQSSLRQMSGALLSMEIGDKQHRAVEELLENGCYKDVSFVKDLAGIERIAVAFRR